MIRRFTAALCAGLMMTSFAVTVFADEETASHEVLPSGMTLDDFEEELEMLDGSADYASCAVGVFKGDEVLYTHYFGDIDIKNDMPADENSVYEWGSITKTMIWVSVMQLYEQGRIDLERDVREYLPEGFFQHLSYDDPITMMNLMNHNAGWQESTRPLEKSKESEIGSLGEELQAIEPSQINRPGEVVAYSNYGAAVAGYVVECITGQDFCDYVHENIFEPLGMEHTALKPAHDDNSWVYEHRKNTRSYKYLYTNRIDLGNSLGYVTIYPAGAATGTLGDLMTYAQALVNDDAPLFQNKQTQEMMFEATDFYGESDIPICAHGFWYEEHSVRTCGHSGATTSCQANMLFDLDSKTGVVIMINEPGGNVFLSQIPTLVFGELSPDKYASETARKTKLGAYYLNARSNHHGQLKFIPYLSAIRTSNLGEAEEIGSGLYQFRNEYGGAMLVGSKTFSDGNTGLQMTSSDLVYDRFYLVKLCLLAVYVLTALAGLYMIRIRRKMKKYGKWTPYKGSSIIAAGQIARLISVLAWLWTFVLYSTNIGGEGGISFTAGAVVGIVQMICIAVCAVSALTSIVSVFSAKKENAMTVRYILNTFGCVLAVTAVVYFEMYKFWIS